MRGFVFSIDAMMALLFAFYIISIPVNANEGYKNTIALDSIAAVYGNADVQVSLLKLMEMASKCGEYSIYDENMNLIEEGKDCECNAAPYRYIILRDNIPYIVSMKVCSR